MEDERNAERDQGGCNCIFANTFQVRWPYGESVRLDSYRLGFDSASGQTNDFKNWYSQFPCLTLSIKVTVWRTSRQVYLLCRWEKHLAGFPHLSVVDRRLATPKRACTAH